METCTFESGLLRKKPCGHAAVARCVNCEQPLCVQHALAQLTEAGNKSGKFMCQECVAALKDHAKSMAGVARAQEEKKLAALAAVAKGQMAAGSAPAPAKTAVRSPAVPPQPETPKPTQQPDALEFTPDKDKPS